MIPTLRMFGVLCLVSLWAGPAAADSTDATCDLHRRGDEQRAASGPCTFSQRQGHVDIDLRNGRTFRLDPTGKADHFKDQDGEKVERVVNPDGSHRYQWEHKNIVVTFSRRHSGAHGAANGETPPDLRDLVGGRRVGGEVDDELARRGYERMNDQVSGDEVWSSWRSRDTRQCVTVHMNEARKVRSIVNVPDFDCRK